MGYHMSRTIREMVRGVVLKAFKQLFSLADRIAYEAAKSQLAACGRNVHFSPMKTDLFYPTLDIGSNVYIGPGALFLSSESYIKIGNKVLFGPNVTVVGGNHSSRILGKYMFDYKLPDKLPSDDAAVIIDDDV